MATNPWSNTAEGGTNGTTVTTANSGGTSGGAFDAVTIAAGHSFAFSNTHVYKGALAYSMDCPSSGTTKVGISPFTSASSGRFRCYGYFGAYPSSTVQFLQAVDNGTGISYLALNNTGKLVLFDSTNTNIHVFTNSVPLSTWVRLEYIIAHGSSSTNGSYQAAFYTGDSLTATETYSTTTSNAGTAGFNTFNLGKTNSSPTWTSGIYWDDLYVDAGVSGTTFIGPSASATLDDLKFGGSTIPNLYVGTNAASAVYYGSTKVWP